ncbi:two component transcriptional regulator, LuxR family [Kribbella flavida DSM 17836]|uniref:Two component transcriptional regulator, LuxR family n=1 Tax=Kribbella flavida (strain DSM 17836 / JCM 10339 / NBRC 14399) TaxID=479435 RepID=D2PW26_KRIFD|nr:response regulator transcription factor [Kribbella flavida]ADB29683.1 two component transcriptional regulator, LuxR family [Kribbella flavida DSM 17836]
MPDRIRLLLVDDQILSRGVLRSGLERERDLEIVAELKRSDDVVAAAKQHRANIALVDAAGSGRDSIIVTTELRTSMPECRVVMLTTYGRPGQLRRGLEAGAKGIALKGSPAPQLADAVRRVHLGLRVVDANLAAETLHYTESPLNEGETETLRAARDGGTVAAMAEKLAVSERVVRTRLWSAIGKTGARTRADAITIAEHNGWLYD